jgi:hypothetical protein
VAERNIDEGGWAAGRFVRVERFGGQKIIYETQEENDE